MERKLFYHTVLCLVLIGTSTRFSAAEDEEKLPLAFSADVAATSKYIWRGQRLTDGWSLQPAGTLGIGDLSLNVWGNLDLEAVNEGDALYLSGNPAAPPGDHNGLQGHFSEVDYTFSYAVPVKNVSLEAGTIVYTFPERSASLPATVEVYSGVNFETLPLSPTATLYIDVDETHKGSGSTGLYFVLGATHFITFGQPRFPGLELDGTLAFVNKGFGKFYYGEAQSGVHDVSLTLNLPITLGERLSAGAFLSYAALLGDFRDFQYLSARTLYLGKPVSPATAADSVFGGLSLSLEF